MIFCSASCSVRPSVISLVSCSPAILPMAASWMRAASTLAAVSSGIALTDPSSMMIASQAECPVQRVLPLMTERNTWWELPRATDRETRSQPESSPVRSTEKSVSAVCSPWVMSFSRMTSRASFMSSARVIRLVESTPLIWVVSIFM